VFTNQGFGASAFIARGREVYLGADDGCVIRIRGAQAFRFLEAPLENPELSRLRRIFVRAPNRTAFEPRLGNRDVRIMSTSPQPLRRSGLIGQHIRCGATSRFMGGRDGSASGSTAPPC
jgi:hypothetical protein